MDLSVSSTSHAAPLLDAARLVGDARTPQATGFMTTLESTLADPSAAAADAEALVGTRIEAPPGGCGCDALVATVSSTMDTAAVRAAATTGTADADAAVDIVLTRGTTIDAAATELTFQPINDRAEVRRGDLLELLGASRNHLAIARGMGEMIRVNPIGIVEITEIPWALVEGRTASSRR